MNRKIVYILLVLAITVSIIISNSGCASQSLESDNGGGANPVEEPSQPVDNGDTPVSNDGSSDDAPEDPSVGTTTSTGGGISGNTGTEGQGSGGDSTVTISVNAATILDNLEDFDKTKVEILPADGQIVVPVKVPVEEGDTVFDVLLKVTKEKKIHMEYVSTPLYKSNYIEGIGNIYEIDAGPLSGWMYKVNGVFPNYGCGRYTVEPGDVIEWVYTCDLGRDVGGDWNEQNSER